MEISRKQDYKLIYAQCLKVKDLLKDNKANNVQYQCIKSMAELESNIDGSKSIKKLILE